MLVYIALFPLIVYILNFRIKNLKKAILNKNENLKMEIALLILTLIIIGLFIYINFNVEN